MKKCLKILAFKVYPGIPEAFAELGHKVKLLSPQTEAGVLKKIIAEFKPDLAFALDNDGLNPGLFIELKIPHIAWFLDNPLYWLGKAYTSPYYVAFVHDKVYVNRLKKKGFKRVFYLPLGTNPAIFSGLELTLEDQKKYGCNISFVGNSIHDYYRKYRQWIKDPEDRMIADKAIQVQTQNPLIDFSSVLESVQESFGHSLTFKEPIDEEILIMCMEGVASSGIRREMLEEIAYLGLSVYGDEGWESLLNGKMKFFKPIPYSRDGLAKLYLASKINLNISRVQFKSAINQRPFDISCAGRFILTDYRRDLGELFDLGREMICFRDKKELRDLAEYFLRHPEERREIAKKAQKRTLGEHTYLHRIERLIKTVREVFGI